MPDRWREFPRDSTPSFRPVISPSATLCTADRRRTRPSVHDKSEFRSRSSHPHGCMRRRPISRRLHGIINNHSGYLSELKPDLQRRRSRCRTAFPVLGRPDTRSLIEESSGEDERVVPESLERDARHEKYRRTSSDFALQITLAVALPARRILPRIKNLMVPGCPVTFEVEPVYALEARSDRVRSPFGDRRNWFPRNRRSRSGFSAGRSNLSAG